MSVCRGCGKQIIWMRTAEGKAMPCDPEVHKVYAGGKKESFLSLNGHMVRGNTEGGEYIADGRVPHWATCPKAKQFKRKR